MPDGGMRIRRYFPVQMRGQGKGVHGAYRRSWKVR